MGKTSNLQVAIKELIVKSFAAIVSSDLLDVIKTK